MDEGTVKVFVQVPVHGQQTDECVWRSPKTRAMAGEPLNFRVPIA